MKTIILSVSIVLCASMFTSCRSDKERAYEAECCYRLAKQGIYSPSDTTKFKKEFESLYRRMDAVEREFYKDYRREQRLMEETSNREFRRTKEDINSMLND